MEIYLIFQFHYGSIKSLISYKYFDPRKVFQFHYGSIKSGFEIFNAGLWQISIPLWFD